MSIKNKLVTAVTTAGLLAGLFGSAFVPAARAAAGDGFSSVPGTPILEVLEQPWFSSTGITNSGEVAFTTDAAGLAVFTPTGGALTEDINGGATGAAMTATGGVATVVTAADMFTSAAARQLMFFTPSAAVSTSSIITVTTANAGVYAFNAQSATPVASVTGADVIGTNAGSQVAATGNYVTITLGDGLAVGSTSVLDIAVANGTVPTAGLVAGTATLSRTDSTNLQVPSSAVTNNAGTTAAGTASAFRVTYAGISTSTITISGVKDAAGVLTRATLQTITITWTAAAVSGVPTTADSDAGIDDDLSWAADANATAAGILAEDCSRDTLGCAAKAATASATSVFFGAVYAKDGNEAVAGDTTKKWSMSLSGTAGQLKLASGAFTRSAEIAFDASGRTPFEIAGNGIAGNTTLTITYGGVTFASFTVSFFGTVNSIEKNGQSNYAIVKTDGTTTSVLTVKGLDSAGVNVDLALADGAPTVADSRFTASEALTGVAGDIDVLIDCNGYTGTSTATWTLTGKNAISTTFTCSTNAVSDINVSFETASVAVGGTAYVVVELLDAAGLPVPDSVTLVAGSYKSIAVANGLINPSSLLNASALATAPDAAAATSAKLTVENGKFKIPFYATTGGTGTFTMTVVTTEWDASAPLADVTYTASIKIGTSANSIEAGPKKKVATANFGATAAGGRIAFTIENAAGTTRTYYRKANASGVATYTINRAGRWTVYASYGDDITDSVTLRK